MSSNYFRERKLMLSDSLNGQRWIFLKKGLDDFRDGFPPSSDNMIVYGTKRAVPIIIKNDTLKSSCIAEWKERKKCKTQVCLSKLSPLQQARRDYVAQLFQEVIGVLYPEMHLRDEVGYSDYEQKNQPFQEMQEDKQTKATGPRSPLLKESRGKNTYTWFSKKKIAAREKVAKLNDFTLLDENIKRVTKHFCDWITTLGGGNCNIDEDALMKLFSASCESKATLPTLFHVVQLSNMQAEQPKGQELSPPWATGRSSHHISHHRPCYVKEMEISQLHSTHAFKEFLERKGYRKPQFLLKMLAGGDGAHEETSKACK